MTVTSSFQVFRERMINNGSLKKPIKKRINDKIITYDPNNKKLSYQMVLCLGLLPDEVEYDISKMLHMDKMKNDVLQIHYEPQWGGYEDYQFNVMQLCDKEMMENSNERHIRNIPHTCRDATIFLRHRCQCNHKNGKRCGRRVDENMYQDPNSQFFNYPAVNKRFRTLPDNSYRETNYRNVFPEIDENILEDYKQYFRMCKKHRTEWSRSNTSHRHEMIRQQLENMGYRINKHDYLVRNSYPFRPYRHLRKRVLTLPPDIVG